MKTSIRNHWDRLFWRVVWSALLTVAAFAVVKPLTVWTDSPEVMRVLIALAVVFWVDISLLIGRMLLAPTLDMQLAAKQAMITPSGSAMIYLTMTISTLLKLGAVLWLAFAKV